MAKKIYVRNNDNTEWVPLATSIPNASAYATYEYVDNELGNIDLISTINTASAAAVTYLVDSAPETLNTLNELSAALNDDANFASTISTSLGNKLDSTTAASTYAPIVPTTQTGFRNRIINGDFRIDQRNNGALKNNSSPNTALATTFGADRWLVSEQNTGTGFSQRASDGTGADKYYLSISRPSSLNALIIAQRIEAINSYDLAGKTVTLSFRAAILGGYTSLSWKASYANTTDSFGSFSSPTKTQIATGNVTVDSSFNSYSATFTVPSEATTGIEISFYNTNSSFDATTLRLSNVQLELGSSATPFEQRPIGTELALCQRYYYRQTGGMFGMGFCPNFGNIVDLIIKTPVSMRTATPSVEASATCIMTDGPTNFTTSGTFSLIGSTFDTMATRYNHGSTVFTQHRPYRLQNSNTTDFLAFSAEL
jgi:hypothetical protein